MGTDLQPVRPALAAATERLAAAGIPSPEWDATQLAAYVLATSRTDVLLSDGFTEEQLQRFDDLVARRSGRVPLQHLTGSVGFRWIDLDVGPGVFVPRPETEVVAGWAIDALQRAGEHHPVVVDLCTGSGAIALAIANEVPNAEVHGVEAHPEALAWARRNAAARAVLGDTPIQLHHENVSVAVPELDGSVSLVVSNPPYVAEDELDVVDAEVRDHDPRNALVAGPDGLEVIREVASTAWRLLAPGGLLVVEHSDRQGRSCPDVLRAAGFVDVEDHRDLTGRDRYATARKPSS